MPSLCAFFVFLAVIWLRGKIAAEKSESRSVWNVWYGVGLYSNLLDDYSFIEEYKVVKREKILSGVLGF